VYSRTLSAVVGADALTGSRPLLWSISRYGQCIVEWNPARHRCLKCQQPKLMQQTQRPRSKQ